MPHFVLLSKLTPEGRRTLHSNPSRLESVNLEVKDLGCNILEQYAVLGVYDFVTIVEAPDIETVTRLSAGLGSRGTIKIATLAAMPTDQFIRTLQSPIQIGKKR